MPYFVPYSEIPGPLTLLGSGWVAGGRDGCLAQLAGGQGATNPDEIDIDADDVLSDSGGGGRRGVRVRATLRR